MKLTDLKKGMRVVDAGMNMMTVVTDVVTHQDGTTFAVQFAGARGAHAMTVQAADVATWGEYETTDRWWV